MSTTKNDTLISSQDKRLSILSYLEEFAFYGFPDFDDEQRLTYFEFSAEEMELIEQSTSLEAQVHAVLQLGYFKAKHIFFRFSLQKIPQADLHFVMSHYSPNKTLDNFTVTKHEYYTQRECIAKFFGYSLWSKETSLMLQDRAKCSVKRDISPNFIAHELLAFLQKEKITRPGYSTLQKIVSGTLTEERERLKTCLQQSLTKENQKSLKQLIKNESTLSELAALKQDAKSFGSTMISIECKKHDVLKPLHDLAKTLLPVLEISGQNITHTQALPIIIRFMT